MGNPDPNEVPLARRLGLFDATMIVMGGIIGAGVFVNPSVVARSVHTPALEIAAWGIGGVIALIGAFVYAELAALRPRVGGQYAYLRDAYHRIVAFLYGWTLLLVVQTGGMAGAAIIFGRYFCELFIPSISEQVVASVALAILTAVNCLGVRAGSNVQSALMLIKLLAISLLIGVGCFGPVKTSAAGVELPADSGGFAGLARAMAPVLFAYGGWQTASFVSGEMRNPRRDLPRGLLIGVIGVILCYVLVSCSCLRALGVANLARTNVPASEVMRYAFSVRGVNMTDIGIAISTLGFLSQSILTAPRAYYAMARARVLFKAVGYLDPRTRVPTVAIVLQGFCAAVIAFTGKYDQILNYVVAIDVLFFGLTGASLLIFRARLPKESEEHLRVPWHPVTTSVFVLACWAISISTVIQFPRNAGIGVGILTLGALIYPLWRRSPSPSED